MRFTSLIHRPATRGILALAPFAVAFAACATGVEPDRSALAGAGGDATSASTGGPAGSTSNSTSVSTGTDSVSSSVTSTTTTSSTSGAGGGSAASTSGGAGGAGGSIGSGAGGSPTPTGLHVQYKIGDNNATNDQIKAIFNIINDSNLSVNLSELSIRYWYTLEGGDQPQQWFCDYAMVGAGNVHGAFGQQAGAMADHYMEVTFTTAAVLNANGGQSGEAQARWNKNNFSMMDETNDYSYDATKMSFADWDRVTLYHNGTLVWGVEP